MSINERLYGDVAKIIGLKNSEVEKVVKSMFDYLTDSMESGDRRPIRMQYLGLWECKERRVRDLKEKGVIKDE